jgi:hypothetical protein
LNFCIFLIPAQRLEKNNLKKIYLNVAYYYEFKIQFFKRKISFKKLQ